MELSIMLLLIPIPIRLRRKAKAWLMGFAQYVDRKYLSRFAERSHWFLYNLLFEKIWGQGWILRKSTLAPFQISIIYPHRADVQCAPLPR